MHQTQTTNATATETFADMLDQILVSTPREPVADLLATVPVAAKPSMPAPTWTDKQKNAILKLRLALKAAGSPLANKPVKPTKEEASAFISEANEALNVNVPAQRTARLTPYQRASMRGKSVTPKQWGMLKHMRETAKKMGLSVDSRLPAGCDRLAVMSRGRLRDVRPVQAWTEEQVMAQAVAGETD